MYKLRKIIFRHSKNIITFNAKNGPKPIGPYSSAKIYNGVMYVSGQIGLDPKTGNLISDDVETQTKQAMDNLKNILQQTKCNFEDILKCTLYLKTMGDFVVCNKIYSSYFTSNYPARVAIAAQQLPKGAKFQVQAIVAYPHDKLL